MDKPELEMETERKRRIRAEETLGSMKLFLFDYFHKLGPDPLKNIDIIVETTSRALSSAVSLYNRLEGDVLRTWSIHNEPENYRREDKPGGHICYDMTIRERSPENLTPVVLEKLQGSKWEDLDDNVRKYGLQSYMGYPVLLEGEVVGSLCVVDVVERKYSQIEKDILEAFAKAVALEEERMLAQEKLTRSNAELKKKNREIEDALSKVKTLSGLLPICASCKKIRDDKGYWKRLEAYIYEHTDVQLSHGFCPDCARKLYPEIHGESKGKKQPK